MLHYSGHNMLTHVGVAAAASAQRQKSPQGSAAAQAAVPPTTDMRTRNQIDLNMIQSGPKAGAHFLLLENIIAVES